MKKLTKAEIKKAYKYWSKIDSPTPIQARKRGFEFEKILRSLLITETLEPTLNAYKTNGEQIDGSFFHLGHTFLLEAKWHKDTLPVSSIYSFKGKVDGKFHTTSGVFISMSGYSEDVSDALRFGKTINILLFDKIDMDSIIISGIPFTKVLNFKIRHAGDTGNAYVNYKITETVKQINNSIPVFSGDTSSNSYTYKSDSGIDMGSPANPLFLIICEGKSDQLLLSSLLSKIEFVSPVAFQFKVLDGAQNLIRKVPDLINTIAKTSDKKFDFRGVIFILDEDEKALDILNKFNENFKEDIAKSATGTALFTMNFDSSIIKQLLNSQNKINNNLKIRQLKSFINGKIFTEVDIEKDEGKSRIKEILKSIKWDFKAKFAIIPREEKISEAIVFNKLEELINFLENEAEGASHEVVSWDSEFLKTYSPPDFSEIIYEYLNEYKKQIKKIGWKLN